MSSERTDTIRHGAVAARGDRRRVRAARVEQAVRDFQTGRDREASFRFLYRSYYRPLLRFFADHGLAPEERQDLTQDTFFGVCEGLRTPRRETRFASWLHRLATSALRQRPRAAAERSALDEAPDQPADDEKRQALGRALRQLPDEMRQCLTLRLDHDLSYREIALVMRVTADTVKTYLFQARRHLRDKLEGAALQELENRTPRR